jgi:hypothetical protein
MKFSCEQCQTKYNLPDDRVRGKVLKIRCKKCGCQITVSQGGVRTAKGEGESEDATMVGSRASVGLLSSGGGGGGHSGGDESEGGDSTMIGGMADFFSKLGGPTQQAPDEWHLSLDGNVVDPMPLAELAQRVLSEQGTPGRDIFVWREGQSDWLPPDSIDEVRAAVDKARKNPQPVKAKPAPAPKPADDEDEGGDKTQMGSLDFAALGLGDAKASWEDPETKVEPPKSGAKSEPAKAAAKDAGKDAKGAGKDTAPKGVLGKAAAKDAEPAKSATNSKDGIKAEPLKSATNSKDGIKAEPLKSATNSKDGIKAEPLKSATNSKDGIKAEPAKSAAKDAVKPDVKAAAKDDADDLLEDDALESVDAIEMDIAMPAPPPKGSRPAPPPKPPAMKAPPVAPAVAAPAVATPAAEPIASASPPAPAATPLGSEPTIPASSAPHIPSPSEWAQQQQSQSQQQSQPQQAQPLQPQEQPQVNPAPATAPGEWPQPAADYGQAPTGSPYGNLYGGSPAQPDAAMNAQAAAGFAPETPSAAPEAKSKTPLFAGIAVLVAVLAGVGYFLTVGSSGGKTAQVADAGQDAGAPEKPKEEPVKKPEPPKITGITKAEFDSLWSSGESAVKSCFEKALKKQADLDGKELTVSVDVSDKAKVGEIAFSGADLDDKAKKCIQKALKKWKFPAKDKSPYTAKFPLKISK